MAKDKKRKSQDPKRVRVQFNLLGLLVFSVTLVAASVLVSYALAIKTSARAGDADSEAADPADGKAPRELPPWGELLSYDTLLERPQEYMAGEIKCAGAPAWSFDRKKPDQVRRLLTECGFTSQQVEQALSPQRVSVTPSGTVIKPEDELIFGLSAEARGRLYAHLARDPANHYMRFPFCFPGNSFDDVMAGTGLRTEVVSLIRSVLYRIGDARYFSDFEAVMRRVPSEEQRLRLVKALSSESAVMVRVRIRPTTDIDKLLAYWAWTPSVRFNNLRPLLESLKRLENGGSISLLYLLPPFARERLYTYPAPAQPDDPVMDCHWSTLNFFNRVPDNRFADPAFIGPYLAAHYYQISKPARYGDLIFLQDQNGDIVHSAVFLADDIVFTKNGNNCTTPWMLMRMKNLLAMYSVVDKPLVIVYRSKDQ